MTGSRPISFPQLGANHHDSGYDVSARDSRCSRWCSCAFFKVVSVCHRCALPAAVTYKGQAAVVAHGNLGLVRVDEDPGMPSRAAAALARHYAFMRPPHGLLVYHFHGRQRLGLSRRQHCPGPCFEKSPLRLPAVQSLFARSAGPSWPSTAVSGFGTRCRLGWVPGRPAWAGCPRRRCRRRAW